MKKTIQLFAIGFSTILLIFSDGCKKSIDPLVNNNGNGNGNGNGGTTNSVCKEFEIKSTSQGGQDGIYTFNAAGQLQAYKDAEENSTVNFTYSTAGERQNTPGIQYKYDALGNIANISYSVNGIYSLNVSKNTLNSFVISTPHVTSLKGTYTYNSNGDPIRLTITGETFDSSFLTGLYYESGDGTYTYSFTYSDSLSILNNDPLVHFTNLDLWIGLPLVSNHLPSGLTEGFSGNSYDENAVATAVAFTASESFSYTFDANGRPIQITEKGAGVSIPQWNIIYTCN